MSDRIKAMLDRADWSLIPRYMHDGVRNYFEHGLPPGSFLTSVLCNDLRGACECADDTNRHCLFEYIQFFYSYAPAGSWGSPENFRTWMKERQAAAMQSATEGDGR